MVAEDQSVVSGQNYLLLDLDSSSPEMVPSTKPNCPVIGLSQIPSATKSAKNSTDVALTKWVDLVIHLPTEQLLLNQIIQTITDQPLAAATFITVLRASENISIGEGLMLESLAYSTLQNSHGFRAWLQDQVSNTVNHPPNANNAAQTPVVLVERQNAANTDSVDTLTLTLNRPEKHNAFSSAMRDELATALQLAAADNSVEQILIKGNGSSFCAGGDLTEFGQAKDAALAHLTRLTRSPASLIANLTEKTCVQVHGACIGAGIELPAFAGLISARPDSIFALPEVGFGLIPGAGGTVSIPRRIGRQNTAKLGLSRESIHAEQALEWGLIDTILS